MRALLRDIDGVVHLAAVSRVVVAEQNPNLCWSTNVGGTEQLSALIAEQPRPPWFLFASSREVYGQPERLPCREDAPLSPLNIYARSKIAGERIVLQRAAAGGVTGIIRLSNVYGGRNDHTTRVVPAFMTAALQRAPFRIDGEHTCVDLTFLDDVVNGLRLLIERLQTGQGFAPVHFVSGHSTTLPDLARLIGDIVGIAPSLHVVDPRTYDVSRFEGDPSRAFTEFGWKAATATREGLRIFRDRWMRRMQVEHSPEAVV